MSAETTSAPQVVQTYLDAWKHKDADAIGRCVHSDVSFKGPMSESRGRDAFVEGAQRMFPLLREHRVRSIVAAKDQAMFVYDFVCAEPIGACRTAEFVTLKDGLIGSVEIFFDARPFEKLMQSQAAGAAKH
jgi:ketosteroid isomerase-like protein